MSSHSPFDFVQKKRKKDKITCLTAYDAYTAQVLEKSGIDIILAGDSLGNVILGYPDTKQVTIEDMMRHTQAVRRGAPDTFVVADLPYGSVIGGEEKLIADAQRLIREAGADAVKIEGASDINAVKRLIDSGICVMGHLGYLPQTTVKPRMLGKEKQEAAKLLNEAFLLEETGVYSIVLEMVEQEAAREVTQAVKIPTIGIGSGNYCDGQVLVINDMVGLTFGKVPGFVKKYDDLGARLKESVRRYIEEVRRSS